jgi:hypothetical protein
MDINENSPYLLFLAKLANRVSSLFILSKQRRGS